MSMKKDTATVLIVDDELMIRNGLKNLVESNNLDLEVIGTANNGQEGYEMIKTHSPDIVITDIKMPYMDGLELIKKLRTEKNDTKFVIISGFEDFSYAQRAIRYNVHSYLLKPIKTTKLNQILLELKKEIFSEKEKLKENIQIKKELQKGKVALKEEFLHKAINGNLTLEGKTIDLNIDLTDSSLSAALFEFDLQESNDLVELNPNDHNLFYFIFKNLLGDLLPGSYFETVHPKKNQILFLYNNGTFNNQISPKIFIKKLSKIIKQYYNLNTIVAIDSKKSDTIALQNLYNNLQQLLTYKMYDTENQLLLYEQSQFEAKGTPSLNPDNYVKQMITALIQQNKSLIDEELTSFFESLLYVPTPPPSYVRGMCNYYIIGISKQLSVTYKCNEFISQVPNIIINNIEKFSDLKNYIHNLLLDYSNILGSRQDNHYHVIIEDAQQYIEEHITDKIMIKDVASMVNLSESYFASMFKRITGSNFRSYVLNMKIEYAIKKLQTSDATISEIAAELGYDDYRSFHRMFKNATGFSPSNYMK